MNSRPDKRLPVLIATLATIAAAGLFFSLLPGTGVQAPGTATPDLRASSAPARGTDEGLRPDADRAATEARVQARFQQAVYMLHARQYEHAVAALHEVLRLAPRLPEAHVNMGFALLGAGRHAAARDFFQGAIALRANQINAYYGLALALAELGELPAAVSAMRTYVHMSPADDKFLPRARATLSDWQARLEP